MSDNITKSDFIENIINKKINIKNLGYLPRWAILMIDTLIALFSTIVTFFLFQGLGLFFIPQHYLVFAVTFYIVTNIFFFWLFKTHSGIIRHSSFIDALKLFFSQFSTFTIIIFLNFAVILLNKQKVFLTTGAFLNAILSFSMLFFLRITVKQVYDSLQKREENSNQLKALIYGSDANAIAVANAINTENPSRFELFGFIDKKKKNATKRILDLPILSVKKTIPVLMRTMKVEALIIADNSLSKEDKLTIVEECIQYNFKVFSLPVFSDWEDEKEISKNIKNFEIKDLLERKPIVLDTNSISSKLKGKSILVTGAAGSIGSEIVRQVINFNPSRIILLDQAETPLHSLSLEIAALEKNIEIRNCIVDVRNYETLEKVFQDFSPQVIYHAAAYKHVPMMEENPSQAIFTNVIGTKNVADLAYQYKAERFVMVSTDKAVNPSSVMGASKRIAEMYVQSKHFKNLSLNENTTKYITTRFGNVLGSNGSVVPLFTKQIQEGGPITITHPDIIRYFMTIPEACQLVLEACSMGNGGEIYIFDMGKPVKIIDLARKMIQLAGFKPEVDIKIAIVGLRPGEKLYEELLNDTAKNLATHHEKIMVAIERCDDYDVVSSQINDLLDSAYIGQSNAIVSKMKTIVPEFKSLNSEYQNLD